MAQKPPTSTDRWVAHTIVGLAVGAIIGKTKGVPGFVVGFAVAVMAHQAFDAPVAGIIADLT